VALADHYRSICNLAASIVLFFSVIAESLHSEFGTCFRLMESSKEMHYTPFGTRQQFVYCYCQFD
jgi:hypothetical protein